ncbi:UvrD-helicase domain-containing protein [Clostridium sp. YIM B02505]|uniref:DNA 3'-5' helicase n=1 Tax=Clostridium yunnanense TaxID=2800325 RepID=A0ABS1EQ79_9CLOT|nr:UvrD-helicase domain-containing protein [Clostridium yunnanense]MBK1811539.1 UvrD-helicase domain-containing protein [Clostridium yunnanense]
MKGYEYFIIIIGIVVVVSVINLIRNISIKKAPDVIQNIKEIEKFFKEIEVAKEDYFTYIIRDKLLKGYKTIFEFFTKKPYCNIKNSKVLEFKRIYCNFDHFIKQWNEEYVTNELERNIDLFDNLDGKSLDGQQRRAVVVDEMNNLVLAGAGSGKTLTISAKVKYLIDRKNVLSDEILLISFTRKAAEEMYQRISQKLGIEVEAKTFHKLGLDIITKQRKNRPDISEELNSIVESYFKDSIYNDKDQIKSLIIFFSYYLNIPNDFQKFDNLGECYDYYRNVDFETLKGKVDMNRDIQEKLDELKSNKHTLQGETVKSLEELMIANYLFLNGIKYTYERKYPYESDDKYRKHYRPDFYLNDYDIYLEHFGITKDNKVPWLSKIEEQKYLDGINWKRETHRKNRTILLETYSYYNNEGILLSKLEEVLKQNKVEFKQPDLQEIYVKVFNDFDDKYFREFKKLIATFIALFKSNGYSLESFTELQKSSDKIDNIFLRNRSCRFLDIVKPIYVKYQEYLDENGLIDFNDMINEATNIVKENKQEFKYKYIIIDEYQDISMSRFNLIKEIRNKTNAKIMCVGDDWQSIYRFAGSDIDLFTNFKTYLGNYELLKIENTYRNSQELVNIAGNFIMKNPKQLKKDLKSNKHHSNPIRMINYENDIYPAFRKVIDEIVNNFGEDAQITILGRNNFDIDVIEMDKGELGKEFKLNKSNGQVLVKCKQYPKLKMNFLTMHRSKGLEADNVIIINLMNKLTGLPNKIADDPVLSLVLTDLDRFDFAEERRLFYVALTRTKNSTYLLVPINRQSTFTEELAKKFDVQYEHSTHVEVVEKAPNCPRCQKGFLIIRENSKDNSRFLGCSNYPFCDLSSKHVEILDNHIKCSVCGGYMVKRPGRYGEFYGCTNYPYCNHTLKIDKTNGVKKQKT